MPTRALIACLSLLALVPGQARAKEQYVSEDGKSSVEIRGFYKTFAAGLLMQRGLTDATQALQDLLDQAGLKQSVALPREAAESAHTARIWGRFLILEKMEISVGWQLAANIASDPLLAQGGGLGGGVPVASSQTSSRRLVDFDPVLVQKGGLLLQHNLDLLTVKVKLPLGELVAGRQVLSWGTGHFWNPTDLLSPFAPTDIDREVRHGVDALRWSATLNETTLLDVLFLPQKQGWAQGAVARAQTNFGGFDVSLSAAKYVSDVVIGADTAGDLGPVAVHAEAAYTLGLSGLDGSAPVKLQEHFLRAVAGADWKPVSGLVLSGEYYFNGYGATSASGYAAKLKSDRVTRGEVFGAGQHYLGIGAAWKATDLLTVSGMAIGNLADPSVIVVPMVEYWAEQSVIVRAGAYVPIGKQPNPAALRQVAVSDVLGQTPAFLEAASTLGLRSEYGSSPWGLFAQVGVYF
jgi:hypothetical protein